MTPIDYKQLPPAPIWRRLAALSYDMLLIMALSLGYFGIITWIGTTFFGAQATEDYNPMFDGTLRWFVFLGWIAVIILFYGLFWTRNGQTLGMQAWKIRVQTKDGDLISYQQTVKRFVVVLVALSLYLIGANYAIESLKWLCYVLIVLNYAASPIKRGNTLTELVSATSVVQVPKDQRVGVKSGGVF